MNVRYVGVFAALLMSSAAPALAGPVPSGSNSEDLVTSAGDLNTPYATTHQNDLPAGTYTQSQPGGSASAAASVIALNTPVPILDMTAFASVGDIGGGASASADGFTRYSFVVSGPAATASLHIAADGLLSFDPFNASGQGGGNVTFRVEEQNNPFLLVNQSYFLNATNISGIPSDFHCTDSLNALVPSCSVGFTVNGDFLVDTNTVYNVLLNGSVGVSATRSFAFQGTGANSGSVMLDPTFSVTGPFTIQLSDGFGGGVNLPAVGSGGAPEPDAWALMLLGFTGIGAALRWRPGLRAA